MTVTLKRQLAILAEHWLGEEVASMVFWVVRDCARVAANYLLCLIWKVAHPHLPTGASLRYKVYLAAAVPFLLGGHEVKKVNLTFSSCLLAASFLVNLLRRKNFPKMCPLCLYRLKI